MSLNSQGLRYSKQSVLDQESARIVRRPLIFILDNVYDTYNVGGIFRLADALAVEKLYLCGGTPTPPNIKLQRSAIGTQKIVPWEHYESTKELITHLRQIGQYEIVAVELDEKAQDYTNFIYKTNIKTVLLVGNETFGVKLDILSLCDATIQIPMLGVNKSLNVIVSLAIAGYDWLKKQI